MNRDDLVPLRDALATVAAPLGVPNTDTVDLVVTAWHDIAGDDLAAHSIVRALRDGDCTIEVDAPGWATRARYLTGAVRDLANERAGRPVVRAVNVVVKGS
jgi:hypothetical protein